MTARYVPGVTCGRGRHDWHLSASGRSLVCTACWSNTQAPPGAAALFPAAPPVVRAPRAPKLLNPSGRPSGAGARQPPALDRTFGPPTRGAKTLVVKCDPCAAGACVEDGSGCLYPLVCPHHGGRGR